MLINKNLDIYYCNYQPENIERFKNEKLFVLAGIANPENFLLLLKKNNLNIKEKLFFPDHYSLLKKRLKISSIMQNKKVESYND